MVTRLRGRAYLKTVKQGKLKEMRLHVIRAHARTSIDTHCCVQLTAGLSQIKWCPWLCGSASSFAWSLLFLTMESSVPPSSSPTMTASEMTLPTFIV